MQSLRRPRRATYSDYAVFLKRLRCYNGKAVLLVVDHKLSLAFPVHVVP